MRQLVGRVETANAQGVSGWAYTPQDPDAVLGIEIWDGETLLARVEAAGFREDLRIAGFGSGRHAFSVRFPDGLLMSSRHLISVRFAENGTDLAGSPRVIEQERGVVDAALTGHLLRILDAEVRADGGSRLRMLHVLAPVMERILQLPGTLDPDPVLPESDFVAVMRSLESRYPPLRFSTSRTPKISVIVPTANAFDATYATLAALASRPLDTPHEIILADDASEDETYVARALLGPHVRIHRNETRAGRARTCRAGVALARGEILVFLEPGLVPDAAAIEEIAHCAWSENALVSPVLRDDNGRVVEAGLTFDAVGAPVADGRGEPLGQPRFDIVRDVLAVSPACFALPRRLWARLGGLDPDHGPCILDVADLSLRAGESGRRVLCDGLATVAAPWDHAERFSARWRGGSSLRRFRDAWQHKIEGTVRDRSSVLIIDDRLPAPGRDAGSNVILSHMQALRAANFDIVVASTTTTCPQQTALLRKSGIAVRSFEDTLEQASTLEQCRVVYVHKYHNWKKSNLDLCGDKVRILNIADLHYLRAEREAAITGPASALAASERDEELEAIEQADAVIIHSSVERELLHGHVRQPHLYVVPIAPSVPILTRPAAERRHVGFVGSSGHAPNVDAVQWIATALAPRLQAFDPDLRIKIIGAGYPEELVASFPPNVEYLGGVTDLSDVLSRLHLTISPLRFGAGLKGKVIDSFASGTPCIMTRLSAEGFASDGCVEEQVVDLHEMADVIIRRIGDDDWIERTGLHLNDFVHRNHNQREIEKTIKTVVAHAEEAARQRISTQ